jgi:hypothetical protein
MIIFLVIAILGLIISIIAHFGVLFGFLEKPTLLMFIMNAGLFIWAFFICANSVTIERGLDMKMRKEAFANSVPLWMRIITILMLVYGVVVIAYFCAAGYLVKSQISFFKLTMDKLIKGITSVHVAAYTTAISYYYYYKYLKNKLVRYCTNGHPVRYPAEYCDICGEELDKNNSTKPKK